MRCLVLVPASLILSASCAAAEPDADVERRLKEDLAAAEAALKATPDSLRALARRGDALFFLGRFEEAVRDYDRMIALAPELGPTHWQRGLALYFAGRYDDSAKQFERYYEGDKSDRENGIWRYYAQVEKYGVNSARKSLLSYSEPDREPLPLVYEVCAGKAAPKAVLRSVESAEVPDGERPKQRFYGHLYMGLDAAIVRKEPETARALLRRAVESDWPQDAGYGPNFMWHVARLSLKRLPPAASQPPAP